MNFIDRRALRVTLVVTLLLHAAVLVWAHYWLQAPSVLEKLPPPFYTRVLSPQAAPAPTPAPPAIHRAAPRKPRPAARRNIQAAQVVAASSSTTSDAIPAASAPEPAASVADAASEPAATASEPAATASDAAVAASDAASAAGHQVEGDAVAAEPSSAASAAPPAFFDTWPPNTRLTYVLTGNYRGELHGDAKVLWQRLFDGQQARYQAEVRLSLGLLFSMRLTSQGQVTEQGLAPQVYEEHIGQRQRHARIGEDDVQLNNGKHAPRPDDVQDTASQLIELAHRFATGQAQLAPGTSVHLWLARPTGVDEWAYDLLGQETLYLPRLGAVQAVHLKPRRLDHSDSNAISAEIWLGPSLQYLPVRILLTRDDGTSVDLVVDTIEQ